MPPKSLKIALAGVLGLSLTACSLKSVKSSPDGSVGYFPQGARDVASSGSVATTGGVTGVITSDISKVEGSSGETTRNDLADSGADLLGIPLEVNRLVLRWIDYFQGPGRNHMERYLSRSTRYAPFMKEILRKEGLPEDLIYIALIESGFSSTAHSSASAVGYWQFIRSTGKAYRLRIDSFVDERRDFEKATVAAADYFKGLYNLFGAWYLAIASYNVGENRVKSLVMKNKTRDFWKLARENRLPQETVNYVPKFLAARLIAKDPAKYGFTDVEYMPPLSFDTVVSDSPIDIRKLASEMGLEYDDLRDLNPSYTRGVAPMPKSGEKLALRVPTGHREKAIAAFPQAIASLQTKYIAEDDYTYYRVRRGDTIGGIARKFNVSQSKIMRLNRLSARSVLSVGRRLRVPSEDVAILGPSRSTRTNRATEKRLPAAGSAVYAAKNRNMAKSRQVHVVKRGENLALIARRYGITVRQLASHNSLKRQATLFVGKRLEIPRF